MIKIENRDEVVRLYKQGKTARELAKRYGVTTRTIFRIVEGHGARKPLKASSVENQLATLRPIIIGLLESQGRDFSTCELCLEDIPKGKFDLHHTRYAGATLADLLIVCRRCNTLPENRYLH